MNPKHVMIDPLFIVSVLLAALGALQAQQGLLTKAIEQYPVAFGVAMALTSVLTAVLTAVKTMLLTQARSNAADPPK